MKKNKDLGLNATSLHIKEAAPKLPRSEGNSQYDDTIARLINRFGMTKILGALIDNVASTNPKKEKYLNVLEKDLNKALTNYKNRYKT